MQIVVAVKALSPVENKQLEAFNIATYNSSNPSGFEAI